MFLLQLKLKFPNKISFQHTKQTKNNKWKDRESKHDKKRGVYAYQAVTIKCFLNIDLKSINEEKDDEPRKTVNIIEDYVSSESTTLDSPSKGLLSNIESKPTITNDTPSQPPPKPEPTTSSKPSETKIQQNTNENNNNNDKTKKSTENASNKTTITHPQSTVTNKSAKTSKAASEEPQYNEVM